MMSRAARLLVLCAVAGVACQSPGGAKQSARAADEWSRAYPLASGGELQILNTSGAIQIQSIGGQTVEVRAERVALATTLTAARDLLTHISIRDESLPDRLTIQTERVSGLLIGASFEVLYHVKVPASAIVRARTTDGAITVTGPVARLVVSTTNGNVTGNSLAGGIDVRTSNENVTLDIARVEGQPIDVRTTNGRIRIALPADANANVSATAANGSVDLTGLTFEAFGDQNRRRTRGRINAGGTPIELSTTNGDIQVVPRMQTPEPPAPNAARDAVDPS